MQDLNLIKQKELDKKQASINNEFEVLIQNGFASDSSVVLIVNWIEEFLIFVNEIKNGKTFLKRNVEYETFFNETIIKYPFYQNSNLFEPSSLFSENDFLTWEMTIKYFDCINIQNNKLSKLSDEIMLDFYLNKIKHIKCISNELIKLLELKRHNKSDTYVSYDFLNHLTNLFENVPEITTKNPYPHIFVNYSAYSLFIELCDRLIKDRPKKQLIKEDVSFMIDILKSDSKKILAIQSNLKREVLCDFFRKFELTKKLGFEIKDFKYNRELRLNQIFGEIIKKYDTPFKK